MSRIPNGAGQHMVNAHRIRHHCGCRMSRHSTPARLQPKKAACSRRHPNRPTAIIAMTDGHHARRHRSSCAARRPARRLAEIIRVVSRAISGWLCRGHLAHLRHVGNAEDHEPCGPITLGQLTVLVRNSACQQPRTPCLGNAGKSYSTVLHYKRDASERRIPIHVAGAVQRNVETGGNHRVDLWISLLNPSNRILRQFNRVRSSAPDGRRNLRGIS